MLDKRCPKTCFSKKFFGFAVLLKIFQNILVKNYIIKSLQNLEFEFLFLFVIFLQYTEAYSELCQTSKMDLFPKMINGFQSLTIFAKSPILDDRLCSEYTSDISRYLEVVHLTFPPHIFSIQVKSGVCCITGKWGRVQNKIKQT